MPSTLNTGIKQQGLGSRKRIIIGITGASGVIYGIKLLKALQSSIETHLVITDAGRKTIQLETSYSVEDVESLATFVYSPKDHAAPIASGSFLTEGMAIVPCTIKTLSAIVHSYTENLLVRAADVCLKERRKLVLAVRETPLHVGHLRLMCKAAELGAVILPPIPGFYHRPHTLEDVLLQVVGKILDQFHLPHQLFLRWEGNGNTRGG